MNFEFKINIHKTNQRKIKIRAQPINKLKQSLVLAHQVLDYIEINNLTFSETAKLINVSKARISQLLNLLFLSPIIQRQIIFSNNSELKLLPERKMRKVSKILLWQEQEKTIDI